MIGNRRQSAVIGHRILADRPPRSASATPKRSPGGRGGEQCVWMSMMEGTSRPLSYSIFIV